MSRDHVKRDILRLISLHDGEWYWYQVDRVLSGTHIDRIGPFMVEINVLVAAGLIEVRPNFALGEQGRYWLTEAGRTEVSNMGGVT